MVLIFWFILLHVAGQFFQHHLLKRLAFLHVYTSLLCCRLVDHRCVVVSLDFLSSSIDLCFCLCASTIWFWLLQLCSIVLSHGAWLFQLHFSFSRLLCPVLWREAICRLIYHTIEVLWKLVKTVNALYICIHMFIGVEKCGERYTSCW